MVEATADDGKILYPVATVLVILAMLFAFAVLPRLFTPPDAALVGKDAPDFSLDVVANGDAYATFPSGEAVKKATGDALQRVAGDAPAQLALGDLKGKAVVLDFWATWCGPCQAEAPILNKVAQRFKDRGLAVVGVNTSDAPGRAGPWATSHGITFPIVFDDGDAVAPKYGVENLPTLVVVSRAGKILAVRTGITSDAELERLVTSAL